MKIKYFAILYLLFLITSFPMAQEIDELRFTGGAPFDTFQPTIIIPILTEAFSRMGIDFSAQYHPSVRSLILSNTGEYDGELHRVYDFQRVSNGAYPNLIRVDTHVMSVWRSFFTTLEGVEVHSIEDLKPYTIAFYRGRHNIVSELQGVIPEDQYFMVTTDEQAFRMLSAGRVDIVISESRQGNQIIEASQYTHIFELKRFAETRIYSYIHSRYAHLLPELNRVLLEMKEDGSYAQIYDEAERGFYGRN